MTDNPKILAHREWLGLIQPTGLVVTPPALVNLDLAPDKNLIEERELFRRLTLQTPRSRRLDEPERFRLTDFPQFARQLFDWQLEDLYGAPGQEPVPPAFTYYLEDFEETLKPDYVLIDVNQPDKALLLITMLDGGTPLDKSPTEKGRGWQAAPAARFERLLRETGVPVGLLCNGRVLRLVYAPRGETEGHMDFPIDKFNESDSLPMFSAMVMLLHRTRVSDGFAGERLSDLLKESRKYQNEVSTKLAEQVLAALGELLRGFQQADPRLLSHEAGRTPEHLYGGLLTVMMRLVFIFYAEDRGLMPGHDVYAGHYALNQLFEKLRRDETHYPDSMDSRYGAWPRLLSLFRLIFAGGAHGSLSLAARYGELFNPDRFPFLEGRPVGEAWNPGVSLDPPPVPDGVVYRVLRNLLILDGERLSYRALDVEQIGSVYEAMMGYEIEAAKAPSLALRPHGVVVSLLDLSAKKPGERAKWLKAEADCTLSGQDEKALRAAQDLDALKAALGKRVSARNPDPIPAGGLYLQPGQERRKSGSHYTPRELTEPIVRHTMEPIFARLGPHPTPAQILALKVCDPAMGSGAFLVESCRFLADKLVIAWKHHQATPPLPPDEDEVIHARRLVAGRCLYGVDKNPFAVSLAKLSLWLVTLAKEQPFTFLDHALKHGDSLLGLTRKQIKAFHWLSQTEPGPLFEQTETAVRKVVDDRRQIHDLGDGELHRKKELHRDAEDHLFLPRLTGDLILAAYFSSTKKKNREETRVSYQAKLESYLSIKDQEASGRALNELLGLRDELMEKPFPQHPFHWELEFPEVFDRENPGFDAMVGNPPFLGGRKITTYNGDVYKHWLLMVHRESNSNSDLVAQFFRRSFDFINKSGAMGFIATNTIAQGDTRETGLQWICANGGTVYNAQRRYKWPGAAAVMVCVVHILKGTPSGEIILDQLAVPKITPFLFQAGPDKKPDALRENEQKSFQGCIVLGMGFTFDERGGQEAANSIEEMHDLIEKDGRNGDLIFPYIGGAELNASPTLSHHRYVINFGEMKLDQAKQWPDLLKILELKVKDERKSLKRDRLGEFWWQFAEGRPGLYEAIKEQSRVLVTARVSNCFSFAFLNTKMVFSDALVCFEFDEFSAYSILQSRVHEIWARFFGSSLEDRFRYTPTDCFETFPFPENWQTNTALEQAGQTYYEYRAQLMQANDEGMTKTYNRFHDPEQDDPAILKLCELHAAMDRAVLAAYGWGDIDTTCEFLLDYEDADGETSKRKKPWRYRWPDSVHDQVLARLLALNQKRAEAERLSLTAAATANDGKKSKPKAVKKKSKTPAGQITLPGMTD